jgi:hypothetical protein
MYRIVLAVSRLIGAVGGKEREREFLYLEQTKVSLRSQT